MSAIPRHPVTEMSLMFVGRCAAMCAHPYSRLAGAAGIGSRVLLVSAYTTAAYIVVLATLLVI